VDGYKAKDWSKVPTMTFKTHCRLPYAAAIHQLTYSVRARPQVQGEKFQSDVLTPAFVAPCCLPRAERLSISTTY